MTFLLTDYCRGERLIFEGKYVRVARSPYRVRIPSDYSSDLAYLAGYHLGDGYLQDFHKTRIKGKFEILYADEYKNQIQEVISPIFEKEFGISLQIHKRQNELWVGRITCKVLHIFLHQILGMPIGKKGNFQIPEWTINTDVFLREFISGFFDAEGSIYIDRFQKVGICLTNSNLQFLTTIKLLLQNRFGIEFSSFYRKHNQNAFELKTCSKEVILRFCDRIGFKHPHKLEKVKECIERLKSVHSRKRII